MGTLYTGTCSWNYDSWVGLVYSHKCRTSTEYLQEYCLKYRTAEIDNWFYKMPGPAEVAGYGNAVDSEFRFTCKAPREITLTHWRPSAKGQPLTVNENFLSPGRFSDFIGVLKPLLPRMAVVMLEFEYLNREKMPSLDAFLKRLDTFLAQVPDGVSLALEPRNQNYLTREYFAFLKQHHLGHVFSEKLYMPHIAGVYEHFGDCLGKTVVIRLMGGDRQQMEQKTGDTWDRIVEEQPEKPAIAAMIKDLVASDREVYLNVNNHYEGCAPRTIDTLMGMMAG